MADTILVTGGAGFIGSHLVQQLLDQGKTVFVVDDLSTGSLDNLADVRHHTSLHLVIDTILNHPMMNDTVGQVDQVVHLAAAVGVRKIIEFPVETITTNVRGTEIVLDCCHKHGTPLYLASTSEIYGKGGDQLHALSANVRETRSTQRIRVGRRQRNRTCWDCEREWKRMVVPLEPGRPSEARQLLRTQR